MTKTVTIPEKYWPKNERGDVYDIFKALNNWAKDKKQNRLQSFNDGGEELLKSHPPISSYIRYTQYHCAFDYHDIRVDYYPSTGRWHYRGKTYNGGMLPMLNFLSRRIKPKE